MDPASSSPWQLTLDAVVRYPRPGTNVPSSLSFAPDGRTLTFLFSETGDLSRQLWAVDLPGGERRLIASAPEDGAHDQGISTEEALRRERMRLREGGITHYWWAKAARVILILHRGHLYTASGDGGPLRPVPDVDGPISDARLTPDGVLAVFVREGDLWSADVESGRTIRLTRDAAEGVSNGLAEFIAQEEMGRSEGFWISPDGLFVAFGRVDETHIPIYPIVHQGTDRWTAEEHRYPFPGAANARVQLGVVPTMGGAVRWLDLGPDADIYLARVDWRPDGKLAVQIEDRNQRGLSLWLYDVVTGDRTLLLEDRGQPWINLHRDLRFVGADGVFAFSTERSGSRNVTLHAPDGTLVRELTEAPCVVDTVVHVDEAARWLYFLSGGDRPIERHLYRVSLDGGEPQVVTRQPGYHGAVFAPTGGWYAHTFESRSNPPCITIRSTEGDVAIPVHEASRPPDALRPPELVTLETADGTTLYGAVYRPAGRGAGLPPAIVSVYGGPHAQTVTDTWGMTVDLRAQYLASLGFLVFKLDNRGSPRRGLAFEGEVDRRLGALEVQDQVTGVSWLVDRGLVDPRRVGIYGWSYGGYMTLMCLLRAPDVFAAGVAGAPVTDWDGYDTHYTERYMGTPAENVDGYREASALTHVASLRGKLMLVHGLVDENVHFRHTARLISALTAAGKDYDLLLFPEERHMPRDEAGRRYLEARVVEFFVRHLMPARWARGLRFR